LGAGARQPLPGVSVCRSACGFRSIQPYTRTVIEIFPVYRQEQVLVVRFQCLSVLRTFSLLPHQLVPYHQYTAESIVWAVWFVAHLCHVGSSAPWSGGLNALSGETNVTAWLMRCWLYLLQRGFRGGHAVLMSLVDLSRVRTGGQVVEHLREVHAYLAALGIRAPPPKVRMTPWLKLYGLREHRFLLGTPSQQRTRVADR
jgi:hypothetical protein